MTFEELLAEGRRLERPSAFLRPQGNGPIAAVWYEPDSDEIDRTGHRCWLTVDAAQIPGLASTLTGYLSIFTDEKTIEGGRIDASESWPTRKGTPLYAHPVNVLPPIDAVFARGSEAIGTWLESQGWNRNERYCGGLADSAIIEEYEQAWMQEYPLYLQSDVYAALGGWHFPGPDDDWHDLIDDQLMVLTIRDSEPWVEAWRTRSGQFKVIQRIT